MTDDELIDEMIEAMDRTGFCNNYDIAKAALDACRPIIQQQERERCLTIAYRIAAAIKETGNDKVDG